MAIPDHLLLDTTALHEALLETATISEPDQAMRCALEHTLRLLGGNAAAIGLVNDHGQVEFMATSYGEQIRYQADYQLHCLEQCDPEQAKESFLCEFLGRDELASGIAVPLIVGPCVYGFLAVGHSQLHDFQDGEHSLLMTFARHTIISLKRSLAFEMLEREHESKQVQVSTPPTQPYSFNILVESLPEGLIICDNFGTVVLTNEHTVRLFGSDTSIIGQSMQEWLQKFRIRHFDGRPLDPDEISCNRVMNEEVIIDMPVNFTNYLSGREQYARLCAAPIRDDQGFVTATVILASDTARTQELEKQRNEFLSIASHELKTPITSIKGFGQFIRRRLRQSDPGLTGSPDALVQAYPKVRDQLDTMIEQIDRLTGMINDLLDVSRLQSGRFEYEMTNMDLRSLVAQTVDRVSLSLKKPEQLMLNLPDEEIPVYGDSVRLDQVITNLTTNALKYSPQDSSVEVTLSVVDGKAHFTVRDYGIGIDPEDQKHLFNQFYRASNARSEFSGLGLGLYISKEIVTRHGGQIWVESTPGEGSTFHVTLPLHMKEAS